MLIGRIPKVGGAVRRLESLLMRIAHPRIYRGRVVMYGRPIVSLAKGSELAIADGVCLISDPWFSEPGVSHPCVMRTISADARILIGENCGLSGVSICAAESVTIGRECLIGADVIISDTDFHPVAAHGRRWSRNGIGTSPVEIEENVFIGARAMVLKGSHIGEGSVIGAGAVVVGDIPPWSVAVGVPAVVVGRVPDAFHE